MSLNTPGENDVPAWYKQGWPWFIVSIPAVSVVLGVNMLYLALQTNNSLVVDDYYKQGKLISQYAERDYSARALQLTAKIESTEEGIQLQLQQLPGTDPPQYPEALNLRWVHVTQSHKDGASILQHLGGGWYVDDRTRLPVTGVWRLHIEPLRSLQVAKEVADTSNWRLVSDRFTTGNETALRIDYR